MWQSGWMEIARVAVSACVVSSQVATYRHLSWVPLDMRHTQPFGVSCAPDHTVRRYRRCAEPDLNDVHALKNINTLVTQTTVALIGPFDHCAFPPTHLCCISYCFGTNVGQRFQKYVHSCKDHRRATNSWKDVVSNISLNFSRTSGTNTFRVFSIKMTRPPTFDWN